MRHDGENWEAEIKGPAIILASVYFSEALKTSHTSQSCTPVGRSEVTTHAIDSVPVPHIPWHPWIRICSLEPGAHDSQNREALD